MNEKSVTSYELILENCETIILSNTDLIEANFAGLDKHIDIWQSENQVLRKESLVAKDALLIFDAENLKARRTSFSNGEYNAYERVTKHSDIVAFAIDYENSNNNKTLILPIEGENGINESKYITFDEEENEKVLKIYFN